MTRIELDKSFVRSVAVIEIPGAEAWVRAMVADGFAFRLMAGGDPMQPGDYNAVRGGADASGDLIAALAARRAAA